MELTGDAFARSVLLALSTLLAVAALSKMANGAVTTAAIRSWGVGGAAFAHAVGRWLPRVELGFSTLGVVSSLTGAGVVVSLGSLTLLFLAFVAGQSYVLSSSPRGSRCGCFGRSSAMGIRSLMQVSGLSAIAAAGLVVQIA